MQTRSLSSNILFTFLHYENNMMHACGVGRPCRRCIDRLEHHPAERVWPVSMRVRNSKEHTIDGDIYAWKKQ